ncbi:pannexin-1a [Latimeria chalumnae]|uniref:Pannexin n=1 Tax=Latimeria chalumnae TaxID=7897 RepID=H3A740_LATCH|nr:PREDICTED: pannexin-1 [Latimeria chalumnae]|eukprot:XP_006010940.1 PREDICTED: pannexin-1 [Latimeria chalumnae]
MAIAHVATEYVFSDFMLKDSSDSRYKGLRVELAVDMIVTCVSVGLPLLLISLAFAQEVSVGTQISCFSPTNFSWRQAQYVDAFCWAAVQQQTTIHSDTGRIPLWLHKFFPYILLLLAILLYAPALFWRFTAAPHLYSDLKFIMEELDKAYNRAIKIAQSIVSGSKEGTSPTPEEIESLKQSTWDIPDGCFKYPIVEQYLKTKKKSNHLIIKYVICRIMSFVIILLACVYLGYYISLASLTDEFSCNIRTGILENDTSVPEKLQCKLIAVGIFQLLSYINLIVFVLLLPVIMYTMLVPLRQRTYFLRVYEILPTLDYLDISTRNYNDLSLYLLFLEENLSELKSYKCLKVIELIMDSGEGGYDSLFLLTNFGQIRTDVVDGKSAYKMAAMKSKAEPDNKVPEDGASGDGAKASKDGEPLRQRLVDSLNC